MTRVGPRALQVSVDGKRGVYLRQSEEVSKKGQWAVTVKPVFHEDDHNDKRVRRVMLACDDTLMCGGDDYDPPASRWKVLHGVCAWPHW